MRARLAAMVWATACLLSCLSIAGTAAASPAPVVHVSTRSAQVGQLVQVTGSGWSPVGQTVQIELCGQDALNLSNDCDQADQYTAAIRAGGIFYGALTIHLPPSPCPCVIAVATQGTFSAVDAPITVVGAPVRAIPPQKAQGPPVAVSAKLLTPMSTASWFGGPKAVTLQLRVTNVSAIEYDSPTLSVDVGRGADPTGFVVSRPLAPLAVGATQVLRIPVTIPAFTLGHYTVRAQVMTGDGEVATVVGTSSYPWGILVAAALALQAVLLLVRNRVRARLAREGTSELPVGVAADTEGATAPVPVIDLRTPAKSPADAWTTTTRLALLLPEQNLTCSVEVLACPAVGIQRTTVRAWDDFATSPWDAVHEGSAWAEIAEDSSNALLPGRAFNYRDAGLELELQVSAVGPQLRLGHDRTVVPVRVEGFVSPQGQRYSVDIEATLEQTWVVDSGDGIDSDDSPPRARSLTYGHAAGGDSFYLLFSFDGSPVGWLVRDGRPATLVQAVRRVEDRFGPYPARVTVEMSDSLGRRAHASGTACNGMAYRKNEALVLDCRTEWDLDGVPAVGEDRSGVTLTSWQHVTRAGSGELADTSS